MRENEAGREEEYPKRSAKEAASTEVGVRSQ